MTLTGLVDSILGLPCWTVELRFITRDAAGRRVEHVSTSYPYVDKALAQDQFDRLLRLGKTNFDPHGRWRLVLRDNNQPRDFQDGAAR
jgi:hypothetical protein